MHKSILTFLSVILLFNAYAQDRCIREFIATINYSNPALYQEGEQGMLYEDFRTPVTYEIRQRKNETVNKSCEIYDFKKPILIVEGYDIMHKESTKGIYNHYINPGGFGDELRDQGYDIITVNWDRPQAALQLNALILEQFIDHINSVKTGAEELIIMGVSMGGVVVRYALSDMEAKGKDHETRLFISFDAPHQGGHVPLGVQAFLYNNALAGLKEPMIKYIYESFISNGSRQLLQNNFFHTSGGQTAPDPLHTSFFEELRELNTCHGYPKNTWNVAIANGSLHGLPDNCTDNECPGGTALVLGYDTGLGVWARTIGSAPGDWDLWGDGKSCFLYKEQPHDLNEDWYLNVGTPPYDHLPGGYFPWFKEMKDQMLNAGGSVPFSFYENSSFVTTNSALDLSTNNAELNLVPYGKQRILDNTPFDDIWWDTSHENQPHAHLSVPLSEWIYDQIVRAGQVFKSGFTDRTITDRLLDGRAEVYKAANELVIGGDTQVINGGELVAIANSRIALKLGVRIARGASFSGRIAQVSEADCHVLDDLPHYTSSTARKWSGTEDSLSGVNYVIDTVFFDTPIKIVSPVNFSLVPLDDSDTQRCTDLQIYPNPSEGNVNIRTEIEFFAYEIVDEQGKVIISKQPLDNVQLTRIDLSDLNSGMYFLILISDEETLINKILLK